MGHETAIIQRLQIAFGKFGALRYSGTLDIAKVWERVLRRADLPLLYTQGFNTRPRMQLASALSLGISSECEIVDVALREVMPTLDGVAEQLRAVAPEGLKIYHVDDVPVNGPPLQTLVRSAEYRIQFVDRVAPDELQARVNALLAKDRIVKIVERKRKKSAYDLRPMILDLRIGEDGVLLAHLAAGEQGNLRPDEVIEHLGLADYHTQIHKFAMHLDDYDYHVPLNARERIAFADSDDADDSSDKGPFED